MYDIQPIAIPIVGTVNKLSIQINPFQLFPSEVQTYVTLSGENAFHSMNITIPQSVVEEWGTDDSVVLNYIVQELGITLAPTPEPQEEVAEETEPDAGV